MKKHIVLGILVLAVLCLMGCPKKNTHHQKERSGEKGVGLIPELFGSHLATDNDNRHSPLTFSLDGLELFYSVYVNNDRPQKIFFSKLINNKWSAPVLASFSGTYTDGHPLFSPDGKRIYYYSKRPLSGDTNVNDDYDIWFVDRTDIGWSKPVHLGKNINTEGNENLYTISENGDLYFNRRTEDKKYYLLKSKFINGAFSKPSVIKELSNQKTFSEPVSIEGEDFFIYTNNVQKGRFFYAALYISYKNKDGSWTTPRGMGDMINYGEGRFPSFSPDKRSFFFLSYRSGISQYYRVNAKLINYLKTEDLDLINQLKMIMINSDLTTVKDAYDLFIHKHADYYHFSEILFNEVGKELVASELYKKAIEIYKLNFELYPQLKFYPQKLIVSLLNKNKNDFKHISSLIVNETNDIKKDLLEEINLAGEVFLTMNRTAEAIKIFKLNAEINPDSTWPFYKLGKVYFKLKDKKLAREYFNKALKLDPGNIYAKNYLKELNSNN